MPFDIPVTATGFGAPFQPPPAGNFNARFRNRDLVRAAIMAGHPNGAGNGPDPLIRSWRLATIKLAVQHSANNRLTHPRAWQQLDTTERGQVRNILANSITKLLCERVLQAPLMVFLNVYGMYYGFRYDEKMPDYIAQTLTGAWIVIEAKGRNKRATTAALQEIKEVQAEADPAEIPARIQACVVSWIGQQNDLIEAWLHDPPPPKRFDQLPLDNGHLIETYYAPLLSILREDSSWAESPDERMALVKGADLRIGLHPKIATLLQNRKYEDVCKFLQQMSTRSAEDTLFEKEGFGPDGIRIVLGEGWPKEIEE